MGFGESVMLDLQELENGQFVFGRAFDLQIDAAGALVLVLIPC